MGEEAIQHCRSYALDAERKMGEMLAATERARPGPDKKVRLLEVTEPPTLEELGVTKRESAQAQALAEMPDREAAASWIDVTQMTPLAEHRRPTKEETGNKGSGVTFMDKRDSSYLTARIARDCPEVLEKMKAAEMVGANPHRE